MAEAVKRGQWILVLVVLIHWQIRPTYAMASILIKTFPIGVYI